jgi:hypothetical protein
MSWLKRMGEALGFKDDTPVTTHPVREPRQGMLSTQDDDLINDRRPERIAQNRARWAKIQETLIAKMPKPPLDADGFAMDSVDSQGEQNLKSAFAIDQPVVNEALLLWYAAQTFIGVQMCAIVSQHWFINKACWMPAHDAIRKGYKIVSEEGKELPPEIIAKIKAYDKAYKINRHMERFIANSRRFGIRIAIFKVNSPDPLYYEKPFNIDGVLPNSYRGIVQPDPYWCAPMLDAEASSNPASLHFYEPTWWIISGKKYHRSHLIIYVPNEVADVLKPTYIYGGIPLPQMMLERSYAAERTTNEGPLLAMTKRTTVMKTDAAKAMANLEEFTAKLLNWIHYRDNYQVKVIDKEEDEIELHETSLTDLDSVIMTQWQLNCSIAEVPATKMLNTQPKGFGATGEFDESGYHESLETLQTHGASPLLERHHQLVIKSFVAPQMGMVVVTHEWNPLDAMTAKELAETNLAKAQSDLALVQVGSIDQIDARNRLINDPESGYSNIPEAERSDPTHLMGGEGENSDDNTPTEQNADPEKV